MYNIDLYSLKTKVFYATINELNTSTFIELNDLYVPLKLGVDLYMYGEQLLKSDNNRILATIYTTFINHLVHITDFRSSIENVGYGKYLFFNLLKTIDLINSSYRINTITGELSSVDYLNWGKLAYFYSNMQSCISKYNIDLSYSLEFSFNDGYSVEEFLRTKNTLKNKQVNFRYNLLYH